MIQERFTCQRDGLTIRGRILRPEGERLPVLIASHGFLSTSRTIRREAAALADMGFAVVSFYFNGGGPGSKSDGVSTEMSVLTEKADLLAVFEAVCALPWADPEDVTLCGFSQGGLVSALAAVELQERVKRLILFYPALCIPDDARAGRMMFARFDPKRIPDTFRCGPMKLGRCYAADVIGMDPFEIIGRYTGPVLILHGTKDAIVPVDYARRAYRAYRRRRGPEPGADVQLVLVDGAGHELRSLLWDRGWLRYAFFAVEKFLEGKAPVLNVDVRLTETETQPLPDGTTRARVHFVGEARSPWFVGSVRAGSYDEQIRKGNTPDTCHADYFLDGTDWTGARGSVRICNDMPTGGKKDWNRGWVPTVLTDCAALGFLNDRQCETYAEMRRVGPLIHIYAKP